VMLWGWRESTKPWMVVAAVGMLVMADLYTVNKRYLSHESFCSPELSQADPFPLSDNDRAILADTAMNYRVMDIPQFNGAAPSYHHKMVGGYHAAKLTRYQDLIDRHLSHFLTGEISPADWNVLDMLNARYIITPDGQLSVNPDALGNAWFVDSLTYVAGADNEMEALGRINPATVAVADKKFADILGTASPASPGDTIFETTYAPDRLTYHVRSAKGGTAVFSEVYFPWGWQASVDGKPVDIGRVNYLLRAIAVPPGEHTVEFEFRPRSVTATVAVAYVAVIAVYVLLFAALMAVLLRKQPAPARRPLDENDC
ncbi:MAG: YfhO family protein, partial [Muribaculaceae bacterium]|nr:YfhO family protein [Muribaculaceae bacterium]